METKAGSKGAAGMARAGHSVILHQGPDLGRRLRLEAENRAYNGARSVAQNHQFLGT
jgi:hypothetical protein